MPKMAIMVNSFDNIFLRKNMTLVWKDIKTMGHILEVNLEDSGGAFSLMFQVQKQLVGKAALDYFSMASFKNSEIISEIRNIGGNVYCAGLRKNRLLGHIMLPFVFLQIFTDA